MTRRSVHVKISGRVQGVGYRARVEVEAGALGLAGWVRNRRDGSVEALIAGPAEAVAAFLARAWDGPPAAAVTAVDADEAAPPLHPGFEVRATE